MHRTRIEGDDMHCETCNDREDDGLGRCADCADARTAQALYDGVTRDEAAREAYAPAPREKLACGCRECRADYRKADAAMRARNEPLARQRTLRDILEGRWF